MSKFLLDKEARTLTPGSTECHCVTFAGPGKVYGYSDCATCGGTGDGPRGGRRGCKKCHGMGRVLDRTILNVCSTCAGTGTRETCLTDSVPKDMIPEIFELIKFEVVNRSSNRRQTWNEAHLGLGCIVSVTDYGASRNTPDDELIRKVQEKESYLQACKIVERETFRIATHIIIDKNEMGYSVRAFWDEPMQMTNTDDFRSFGMSVYNNGGNGTLAAGLADNLSLRKLP